MLLDLRCILLILLLRSAERRNYCSAAVLSTAAAKSCSARLRTFSRHFAHWHYTASQLARRNPHFTSDPIFAIAAQTLRVVL